MRTIIHSQLLKGDMLEHIDENENMFTIWFNEKWNTFNLEKNGKCILSLKTWSSFEKNILDKGWSTI